MYVVEYQKWGLPRDHILLVVSEENRLRTPLEVDSTICAELPHDESRFESDAQKKQANELLNIVLKCIPHGLCGNVNPRSPCNAKGKCSKGYPKIFSNETSRNQRLSYRFSRRSKALSRSKASGGRSAVVSDFNDYNRWVVPYNPYLLLKYGADIIVEAFSSPLAAKYHFLYINKVTIFFQ